MNQFKKQFLFSSFLLSFAFVSFTGCKENKEGSKEIEASITTATTEITAYFEHYKTDLMKMLTKDEIGSAYEVNLAKAELKSDLKDKYSRSASYKY